MRNFFLVIVLGIHTITNSSGQSASSNSITRFDFSNVVIADSLSKIFLYHNAIALVKNLKDEKIILSQNDSILGKIEGESSYLVYNQQAGILKKISGKISYKIFIEMKDGKYRYHFSDFIFHYYKQDRFYNMVETKRIKSLDDPSAEGWQKLWDGHRSATMSKMKERCKQLEIKIVEKPVIPSEKVIAKKVEW